MGLWGGGGGRGVLPVTGYAGRIHRNRGTFFRMKVYKGVRISSAEVPREAVIYVFKRDFQRLQYQTDPTKTSYMKGLLFLSNWHIKG